MSKVSVIIPVYNAERYLRECLDSLINQTLSDIEIICVNDGSTDNSLSILNDYSQKDDRIKILNQENQGPAVARNNALKISSSEFIMFCDSDDFYSPDMCEVMYKTITQQDLDIVQVASNVISGYDEHIRNVENFKKYLSFNKRENIDLNKTQNKLYFTNEIWNKIFRNDLIEKYNITFPLQKCGEDRCFIMQYIAISSRGSIIDKKLHNYRLFAGTLSEQFEHDYSLCFSSPKGLNIVLKFYKENNIFENNEEYFVNKVCFSLKKYYGKIPFELQKLYIREHIRLFENLEIKKEVLNRYKLAKYLWRCDVRNVKNILNNKMVYTYQERIFSIKNASIHKVVTILGLKFKFRSGKLVERERFRSLENKLNYANRLLLEQKNILMQHEELLNELVWQNGKT